MHVNVCVWQRNFLLLINKVEKLQYYNKTRSVTLLRIVPKRIQMLNKCVSNSCETEDDVDNSEDVLMQDCDWGLLQWTGIEARLSRLTKMRISLRAVHLTPSFVLNYANTLTAAGSGFNGRSKQSKQFLCRLCPATDKL